MSSIPSILMGYWIMVSTAVAGASAGPSTVCPDCGKAAVETTVYVPTWTTEKRICKETCYREEQRTRKCIVYKKVPVTKEGVIKNTVYVPKTIETKREIEISTPVCKTVAQKYTIQVPVKDIVTKTRMVTKCVPITETRTVCECGVQKEITVTCDRNVCVEETYQCEVDACAEVEQTRHVKVWETKKEMKVVVDRCKTIVPEVRVKKVPVTICEEVPEEQIECYTARVPYEVEKEIEVCVCKMVPHKVMLPCDCCRK